MSQNMQQINLNVEKMEEIKKIVAKMKQEDSEEGKIQEQTLSQLVAVINSIPTEE
jgi:hypothetical protein